MAAWSSLLYVASLACPSFSVHMTNQLAMQGGFTPLGLVVQAQLAARGAQIVALVPALSAPDVQDLTHLLRESTNNELVYAEECDVLNPRSVVEFARTWYRGMKQGNKANPLAGGGTQAPGAPAGGGVSAAPTADAFASSGGETSAIRLDAILFLPLDSTMYSVGEGIQRVGVAANGASNSVPVSKQGSTGQNKASGEPTATPKASEPFEGLELAHAEVAARYHFIKSMLPSIRLLPPDRDIRIVSVVSPWTPTGIAAFSVDDPDWTGVTPSTDASSFPTWQPWCATGAAGLRWLALSSQLQRQIDLLQVHDGHAPAPPTSQDKDEIDLLDSTPSSNIRLVNVSLGFEHNHDLLRLVLPPPPPESALVWDDEPDTTDASSSPAPASGAKAAPTNPKSAPQSNGDATSGAKAETAEELVAQLKRSIDPRRDNADLPLTGVRAGPAAYTRGQCGSFETAVRHIVAMLLWPLLWFMAKAPGRAGDGVTWALTAPVATKFVSPSTNANASTNTKKKPSYARVRPVVLFREAEARGVAFPPGAQTDEERKTLAQREEAIIARWLQAANDDDAASIQPVLQPTSK